MSKAPVCHISTDQRTQDQPPATLLPAIPFAVDLPTAIQAINIMKILLQMLSGQLPVTGPYGINGLAGLAGFLGNGIGVPGQGFNTQGNGQRGPIGPQGKQGPPGKNAKQPKVGRWIEVPGSRVTQKKRIFQDNDNTSDNWVDIDQINFVQWKDTVTGEIFTWDRGADGTDS